MHLIVAILVAAMLRPTPPIHARIMPGVATYYNPGVMEQVVENRRAWGQLGEAKSGYVGYVALRDCEDIGRVVWIWWRDEEMLEGPFLVADCASMKDWEYLERIDFAVDVDWQTAERHDMKAPVPVMVWVR